MGTLMVKLLGKLLGRSVSGHHMMLLIGCGQVQGHSSRQYSGRDWGGRGHRGGSLAGTEQD